MIHAKTLVVDDFFAAVGTANIDNRSFRLNFEVTAILYGAEHAENLSAQFRKDLGKSKEIKTATRLKVPLRWRLAEAGARVLSPLLLKALSSSRERAHPRDNSPQPPPAASPRRAERLLHTPSTGLLAISPQPSPAARLRACPRLVSRVAMEQTNVDRALAALEEQHADDPERATVLRRTRAFKRSWLELGEALSEVRRNKSWEKWGYETFEAYAKAELKLRMDTVEKLTGSFMFLHKSAPEVLRRDPCENFVPSYQAIDFLRRAEERNEQSVSEAATTPSPTRRWSRSARRSSTRASPWRPSLASTRTRSSPSARPTRRRKDKKDIKSAATKLKELLAETNAVPRRLASTVGEALDELLTELAADKKAA